jgi:hypothetical protein
MKRLLFKVSFEIPHLDIVGFLSYHILMDPDTEPPRAGGDIGAPRPTEETTRTGQETDSADPYAGLSLGELHMKLLDKRDEDERQRLIRELKGGDVPTEPNPAKVMRERARKIRRAVNLPEKPPDDPEQSLFDQFRMLDVLFRQLMMDSTESEAFDEALGLSLALRTQNQYRHSLQALDRIIKSGGFTRRK